MGESSQKQIVKKQHFVPGSYLKRFSENGYLRVLDLENKKIWEKAKHYNQVCYKEYFYAHKTGIHDELSQQVESYLKSIEDNMTLFLNDFENEILENRQISESFIWDMSYLMSFMWIRTSAFRNQMNKSMREMTKKMIQLNVDNFVNSGDADSFIKDGKERAEMKEFILSGRYDVTFNNSMHLKFFENVEDYATLFLIKTWRVYIAEGDLRFITSDIPVIETMPYKDNFWGRHISLRNQYFAISPKVLIELIPPNRGKKLKRKRIGDEDVMKHNLTRADSSMNHCYSSTCKEFDLLIKWREAYLNKNLLH
ncbi:MAG: DUF4238 domain-containing protein [Candidatus Buchananbacteria bacterium]|nr:DUF4238 domain-containing protein [Candidatus Buchananbacteria bacterium]